jgi:hypothetical protein
MLRLYLLHGSRDTSKHKSRIVQGGHGVGKVGKSTIRCIIGAIVAIFLQSFVSSDTCTAGDGAPRILLPTERIKYGHGSDWNGRRRKT